MNPVRTILFPFVHDLPFFEGYAWSSSLARRLGVQFVLLSLRPSGGNHSLRDVYQQILEATGHFIQNYPGQTRTKHIKQQVVKAWDDPEKEIVSKQEELGIDLVVLDPAALPAGLKFPDITRHSGAVIVLPDAGKIVGDNRFESILEQSALYNIPNEMLEALGV